jgi:hypothetical protein
VVSGKYINLLTMENKRNHKNKNSYPYSSYHENEDRCPTCLSKLNIDKDLDENDKCNNCRLEKSTREIALDWWNNLTSFQKCSFRDEHIKNNQNLGSLTGREIEEIWRRETKPNQKQIADEIINLVGENQFKEIIKESEKRINRKQFIEFNPDLFKAYIDKFSDEDKVKATIVLLENQKEEYKFNCFLGALKQMNLDSKTASNIMTIVALKNI